MRSYSIGRSKECDVVLVDPSVSRQHAQLIVKSEADIVLFDSESKFGTFLRRDGKWRAITSTAVAIDDNIRIGRHETTIRTLLSAARATASPASGGMRQQGQRRSPEDEPTSRRTVVERDPETGEIVVRRERG